MGQGQGGIDLAYDISKAAKPERNRPKGLFILSLGFLIVMLGGGLMLAVRYGQVLGLPRLFRSGRHHPNSIWNGRGLDGLPRHGTRSQTSHSRWAMW